MKRFFFPTSKSSISDSADDSDYLEQSLSSGTHRYNRKVLKIMILGEAKTGKTTMIKQQVESSGFVYQAAKSDQDVLEGQNCFITCLDGKDATVRLVDSPGNDLGLTIDCIKDCDGFVLVYDVTSPKSLQGLNRIKSLLLENLAMSSIPCIIVGNKIDLVEASASERKVTKDQARNVATRFFIDRDAELGECSGKSGNGVNDVFSLLYSKIKESQVNDRAIVKGTTKQKRGLLSSKSESNDSVY